MQPSTEMIAWGNLWPPRDLGMTATVAHWCRTPRPAARLVS